MPKVREPDLLSLLLRLTEDYYHLLEEEYKKRGLENWSPSHIAILRTLRAQKQLSMQALAKSIRRDKSTLTVLVRRLSEFGYIERRSKPEDRRSVLLELKRSPLPLLEKARRAEKAAERRLFAGIPQEAKERLLKALLELNGRFGATEGS